MEKFCIFYDKMPFLSSSESLPDGRVRAACADASPHICDLFATGCAADKKTWLSGIENIWQQH